MADTNANTNANSDSRTDFEKHNFDKPYRNTNFKEIVGYNLNVLMEADRKMLVATRDTIVKALGYIEDGHLMAAKMALTSVVTTLERQTKVTEDVLNR